MMQSMCDKKISRARTLKMENDLADLDKIRDFLKKNLSGLNISDKDSFKIELSLLEICINIIRYAYPLKQGEILLKTWQDDEKIFFEIRDSGIPFDPRTLKKPDIKEIIRSEKKGGFGVFLSRTFMDGFDYKRENNQNVLTIYKIIKAAEASDQST
jgi:sigma-B regulation protein RsbU (phosphoserine phosphatase)